MNALIEGLEITEFEDDLVAAKTEEGKYQAHWDNESHTWSVTYWHWHNGSNEYGSHNYLGEYHNLALVLHTMVANTFYMLDDVR